MGQYGSGARSSTHQARFRSSISSRSLMPKVAAVSARPTTRLAATYGTSASRRRSRSAEVTILGTDALFRSLMRPPRWRSESAFADALYLPIRSQARSQGLPQARVMPAQQPPLHPGQQQVKDQAEYPRPHGRRQDDGQV